MSTSDGSSVPVGVDSFFITLATLAIVARFLSRKLSNAGLWWDDWFALAALPCCLGVSSCFLAAGLHGFGNHGGDPTFFLRTLYVAQIFYNTGLALAKISVLCFYRRIFAVTRPLKITIWSLGAFMIAWWISFSMVAILDCVPIPAFWNPNIKAVCISMYGSFVGVAVTNIGIDLVLLILPLYPLWKLHLKRHQRAALTLVFLFGYLNPVISVLRIVSFIQLGGDTSEDINYRLVAPALWSAAEVAVAVFSCSLPSMTHFFRRAVVFTVSLTRSLIVDSGNSEGRLASQSRGYERASSLEALRTQAAIIDNGGLTTCRIETSTEEGNTKNRSWSAEDGSHPLEQIKVRRDVDISLE